MIKTQKKAKTIVVPSAVLFVDIRGYTNLSESVDPSVVTKLLGQFHYAGDGYIKISDLISR